MRTRPRRTRSSGGKRGDVVVAEKNAAGIGPQHAGHQIDQRGLAGAVGADQRVAHAGRQLDGDIGGDDQRAEALVQAARGERRLAHDASSSALRKRDEPAENAVRQQHHDGDQQQRRSRNTRYCGLRPENWSRATM